MSNSESKFQSPSTQQIFGLPPTDEAEHSKEQGYRLLVEKTSDIIWSADLDFKWTYVSPSVEAILGFTPAEAMTHTITEALTPASADLVKRTLAEILEKAKQDPAALDQSHTMEVEFLHKNGGAVWTEVWTSFLRDKEGNPAGIFGVTRDITELKQTEEALRRSEQRYRVLTETTSDWVWEVDHCAVYTYASPKVRGLLGYEPEEVVGKTPFDFMPPDEAKRVAELFGSIAGCRVPFVTLENTVLHKNGSRVVLETSGVPLYDNAGRFIGYQGCDRDVTDRKRVEQELKDYTAVLESTNKTLETFYVAAQAATQIKSEFLASVSHEIRTSMTAIMGFADVLHDRLSDPEDIEAARTIKQNSVYLLNLVNDILDLSKIEDGRLVTQRNACSPAAILSDILSFMKVRAAAKNLSLDVQYPEPIPETIQSDPIRLRQILINLISNAVKFTNTGTVRVIGRLMKTDSGQAIMQFDVIDTGVGMTPQQVANLFQPYTQGESAASRTFGGTGLGLVISKGLAESLGGDITVSSIPAKGSTFTLTVDAGSLDGVEMATPAAVPAAPAEPKAQPDATQPPTLPYRLLLVEDSPDNQRLILALFRRTGAEMAIAENGQLAIELALEASRKGNDFDLILMDMQMPVMDGYKATKRLRAEGIKAPIIALTAHAMSGDRKKCLNAGCNDYLSKPIDRVVLFNMVSRFLRKRPAKGKPTTGQNSSSATDEAKPAVIASAATQTAQSPWASKPPTQ